MDSSEPNGKKFPQSRGASLLNLSQSRLQTRSRESIETVNSVTVRMSAQKSLRSITGAKLKSSIRKKLSFGRKESFNLENSLDQTQREPVELTRAESRDMFEDSQSANDSLLTRFQKADQVSSSALFASPSCPLATPEVGLVSPQPDQPKAQDTTPLPPSRSQSGSLNSSPLPPTHLRGGVLI